MKKICIQFNPNQHLVFSNLQKKICRDLNKEKVRVCPVLPLVIHNSSLSFQEKIQSVSVADFKILPSPLSHEQMSLYLTFTILQDKKELTGMLRILDFLTSEAVSSDYFSSYLMEVNSKIKKISPFKLSEIELKEADNFSTWKILTEKWFKL